jgi:iron complex transport system ATP-binding protein
MSAPLLEAVDLQVSVGGLCVCRGLNLRLHRGELLAILGRNGVGKTTLLNTLAGLRQAHIGIVKLCGTSYEQLSARQAALRRSVLAQTQSDAFSSSVLDTALIGRHPHLGRWDWESAADERLALEALTAVGLEGLAAREVHTLSGGERQRLAIATLLVQQPQLFLLDEPLAHLDLNHQVAVLELFAQLAREQCAGVAMVMHDINLAAHYCQRALLLFGNGEALMGATAEVLRAETLSRLYGHTLRALHDGGRRYFVPH